MLASVLYTDLHFQAEPWEYKEPNHAAATKHFESVLADGRLTVLLAEREGVVAGYLMVEEVHRPDNAIKHGVNYLYIHHVATSEQFRRRGVGSALFARADQLASERDLADLRLNTSSFNEGAHAFFASRGFQTLELRMLRRP